MQGGFELVQYRVGLELPFWCRNDFRVCCWPIKYVSGLRILKWVSRRRSQSLAICIDGVVASKSPFRWGDWQ